MLLFLLALGIRLWFQGALPYPGIRDSYHLCSLAENLAQGEGFTVEYVWHDIIRFEEIPHPDDWQPPLYVAVTAGLIGLGMDPLPAGKSVSVLSGAMLVVVIFLAGSWIFDEETGIAAALIAAAYPPLLFYSSVPMTDMLFVLISTIGIVLLIRNDPTTDRAWLALGVVAGLAYLTRPTGGILLISAAGALLWSRGRSELKKSVRSLVILGGAFLLVASPWLVRNTIVLGSPTRTMAGMRLWTMNEGDMFDFDYAEPDPVGVILSPRTWRATASYIVRVTVALLSITPFFGFAFAGLLIFLMNRKTGTFRKASLSIYLVVFLFMYGFKRCGGLWVRDILPIISLAPLFAALALLLLSRYAEKEIHDFTFRPFGFGVPTISSRKALVAATCIACLLYGLGWGIQFYEGRVTVEERESPEHDYTMRLVSNWFEDNVTPETVVMTRHPWHINYYSDLRTVSAPSVGSRLEKIASEYNATILVVDNWFNWPEKRGEPYLPLLEGENVPGFRLLARWEEPTPAAIYAIEK